MRKYFYSHIVATESLVVELENMNLSAEEKNHLIDLVDSSLHHTILDAVLSELSEEDKRVFLQNLAENDHAKLWEHLNNRIKNIEEKIKTAAQMLKNELHHDVRAARKKKRSFV